jgi:ABC-type uncharacterized transport system permease subunit
MIVLEKRPTPSRFWGAATPVVAVLLTMVAGGIMFAALGKDPFEAIRIIFWDPLFSEQFSSYSRPQLLIKAGPLILIAIGLSLGFKAGIWNIGAEGQYIIGAICGAGFGLAFYPSESPLIFPGMIIAGLFGGWAWAMIPGILKTRFRTNEILVSLLLVYVAERSLHPPPQTGSETPTPWASREAATSPAIRAPTTPRSSRERACIGACWPPSSR